MITKLVLNNFKKHESLTILFNSGMTALKGANEAGKSSVYVAVVYALFGARALPLTLAETVTYDKPESSLKVELDFVFEEVLYKIVRTKSGAVISNGTVTANGQAEVTKFVEKLFGVNADAATKLMIASQNGLRGALETGDAVALIEKLANIDLIDTLIGKIQDQLPCGNTANTVSTIAELDKIEEPILDVEDLKPAVEFHTNVVKLLEKELVDLIALDTVDEGNCLTIIARVVSARQLRSQLMERLSKARATLEHVPVKPTIDITTLKELNVKSVSNKLKQEAYKLFAAFKQPDTHLTGDYDQLSGTNYLALSEATKNLGALNEQLATARAMKIVESACGLCGKDLQDVPEVVEKNAKLDAEIDSLEKLASLVNDEVVSETFRQRQLAEYSRAAKQVYSVKDKTRGFTDLDNAVFPPKLAWIGSTDLDSLDTKNYASEITAAEAEELEYSKMVAVRATLEKQVEDMRKELATVHVDEAVQREAEEALEEKKLVVKQAEEKQTNVYKAKLELQEAKSLLAQAKAKHTAEQEMYDRSQASKKVLLASLVAMQNNNALIKKLREARPIVAARLWAIVLASVSTYFSRIRGEVTVVTRTVNNFTANGRAVAGLSGSTLDALGLAIRMALGKTFLPSVNFLLLDEPSAGMDDEREAAMLGLLSTVEYDQVIVVTHSSLCDAFASTVVQL